MSRELTEQQRILQNPQFLNNVLFAIEHQHDMEILFEDGFTFSEAEEFLRRLEA